MSTGIEYPNAPKELIIYDDITVAIPFLVNLAGSKAYFVPNHLLWINAQPPGVFFYFFFH